jgi:class 3 adenylate cyclase
MISISNQLPQINAEFPAAWIEEFQHELVKSALRRAGIVTRTLLVIEALLLMTDIYRTHGFVGGFDALAIWRVATLAFLLSYRYALVYIKSAPLRLRYYLTAGMILCCWSSAVLAGISGDLSTYTIGALGVAAACPLPGKFNSSLFLASSLCMVTWLYWSFPNAGPYWASNIVATCVMGIVIEKFTFEAALREFSHRQGIERQRERADELLYNVFPQSVAKSLKDGQRSVAMHGEVTILFADIVGFTHLSSRILPTQLLSLLEDIFGKFDLLAQRHGIEKIKTIGDAYMAISGAPVVIDHQVERMADFALAIVKVCNQVSNTTGFDLAMRVGIHTGPVVAGVIGSSRLCYDLWGDSVNTAQRLESQGEPNSICVSEQVYFKLRDQFVFEDRGLIDLKGKGPTKSYVLKKRIQAVQSQVATPN